jgi:hypothetical protein
MTRIERKPQITQGVTPGRPGEARPIDAAQRAGPA